ncbi:MAG: bifunctional DNA-formamidopyrimidine glycosylase/DNA-(apurinic or apyrimidinic site) lyase [Candidatus Levybacteria bacterium]|nr:bifunctional DNA-formamidopyrimidine glycosylase/DNA-(apurinic or apyrimidinic site) lyase [Candidatus Levybacteria bacterium]
MPELPEVETIRLGLQKYLVGHKIASVEVRLKRIFTGDPQNIIDSKIIKIERFGKGLVIEFENEYVLAIHIKMTGQLIYNDLAFIKNRNIHISPQKVGKVPNKYTHVIFTLNKGAMLYYNDIRQFGWLKILKKDEVKSLSFFKELGPEPIPSSGQKALTFQQFEAILSKSTLSIKPLIMDQKKIGGIGNIYANDGLFLAKIDPRRKAKDLTSKEKKKLFESLLEVLHRGLKYGGASEMTYVNAFGEEGTYQNYFLVYGRKGKPCLNCRVEIKKIFLGGRGTFFCGNCQK